MQTMKAASSGKSEFDERRGFAAVEAFFKNGIDGTATTSDPLAVTPQDITSVNKNSRLGLGAEIHGNSSAFPKPSTSQDQKILQIGSHRRRKRLGYDDEDDDEALHPHASNDDGELDGDDEQGRTAIAKDKEKKSIVNIDADSSLNIPQRKKKKGKKERQLVADSSQETDAINQPFEKTEIARNDSKPSKEKDLGVNAEDVLGTSNKRKRRKKIRSKQKNIRKDHRDVKPMHVIEKGRPLTAETRAKLQAPKIIRSPLDQPLYRK